MPRLEKRYRGTPDRKGKNPFTGQAMVIHGIPGWTKVWEVARQGNDVLSRYTKESTSTGVVRRTCASEIDARRLVEELVADRIKGGYEVMKEPSDLDIAPPPANRYAEPTAPEVDDAVRRDPENDQAWSALENWLRERGHPRAELMAAGREGRVAAETREILERHADVLLGPLQPHQMTYGTPPEEAFHWRHGFIEKATLSRGVDAPPEVDTTAILGDLLAHPSARFLRELRLARNVDGGQDTFEEALAVISVHAPGALRSLVVGDFLFPDETEISWVKLGDASSLWRALPALESVVFQGAELTLGDIDAPSLLQFEVRTGGLPLAAVRSIAAARWPRLESLIVWFGAESYGAEGGVGDIAPLLAGTTLPRLRHLGLMNAEFTDEVCKALVKSPLLARLESLNLSMGTLSRKGAALLVRHAEAFRHLRALDVSDSCLDEKSARALEAALPNADVTKQRPDDDRYVSVGE